MKNLSENKKSQNVKAVKKSINRWHELIELSQLKEREHPDSWDSYYSNDYYDLISNYENEFTNGGNY